MNDLIFISSPFRAATKKQQEANLGYALKVAEAVVRAEQSPVIVPHLLYPQFLDSENEHDDTLAQHLCLKHLERCTKVYFFIDCEGSEGFSRGMNAELKAVKDLMRSGRSIIDFEIKLLADYTEKQPELPEIPEEIK